MPSDNIGFSKTTMWAIIGVLISVVCYLGWTNVQQRLDSNDVIDKEQTAQIVQNQLDIFASLHEIKSMNVSLKAVLKSR